MAIETVVRDLTKKLSSELDRKDRCTGGHAKRVGYYSVRIAEHLGFEGESLERVRLAALLHDVGKLEIEDEILKKSAPLDDLEKSRMREHPRLGIEVVADAASRVGVPADGSLVAAWVHSVFESVEHHHERWDGRGYPAGLKGDEIPLVARIVAVADTYDAIVSTRPYRRGVGPERALEELRRGRGTQFDPAVVDAWICAISRN